MYIVKEGLVENIQFEVRREKKLENVGKFFKKICDIIKIFNICIIRKLEKGVKKQKTLVEIFLNRRIVS